MSRTIAVPLWVLALCVGAMVYAAGWITVVLWQWRRVLLRGQD